MSEKTPDTRLALLEQSQISMSNDITEIKEIVKSFDEKLDKALAKKADVWVEKAISWAIYTVIGVILLALVYTVVKKTGL